MAREGLPAEARGPRGSRAPGRRGLVARVLGAWSVHFEPLVYTPGNKEKNVLGKDLQKV